MARELPRTIRSLSPLMQRGISGDDYEIIVVDNGSTKPFDEAECRRHAPNLRVHHMETATVSPVPAINVGLRLARGELVGVFIDGARMASPGLLASALLSSRLADNPVIGSIGFHLGPDIQTKSVLAGYDQKTEDALLESITWEEDGYRLFTISTFAGSSSAGWFVVPNETNSVFMKAAHWQRLGGYDPAFVTPGAGLANLDIWVRACADPQALVIMLLGEATFHQVHGGIATNAPVSNWPTFHDEYVRIRGCNFRKPTVEPLFVGRPHVAALKSLALSLDLFADHERRK
jgi:hypothetical protein